PPHSPPNPLAARCVPEKFAVRVPHPLQPQLGISSPAGGGELASADTRCPAAACHLDHVLLFGCVKARPNRGRTRMPRQRTRWPVAAIVAVAVWALTSAPQAQSNYPPERFTAFAVNLGNVGRAGSDVVDI